MTSYRVERFMTHDGQPAVNFDRPVDPDIEPRFRLIGADDEVADTMFALYDGESFQQRWHPELCGVLVEWLRKISDSGYLLALVDGGYKRFEFGKDERYELDEAADYIEDVTTPTPGRPS